MNQVLEMRLSLRNLFQNDTGFFPQSHKKSQRIIAGSCLIGKLTLV